MDQETRYFVPSIEDARIGYDYEYRTNVDVWVKHTLYCSADIKKFLEDLEIWSIRVPYLTKEQIEAEGWKRLNVVSIEGRPKHYAFEKGNYLLGVHFSSEIPFIGLCLRDPSLAEFPFDEKWRTSLPCRCINDFRLIMKMLCIK